MPIKALPLTVKFGKLKKFIVALSFNKSPYIPLFDSRTAQRDQNGNMVAAPHIYTSIDHACNDIKKLMKTNNLLPSQVDAIFFEQLPDDAYPSISEIMNPNPHSFN